MVRVGILGLGFMGRMHFKCYKTLGDVSVVAICDTDESRFRVDSSVKGNIEGAEEPLDFTGIEIYTDFDKMLGESEFDALSITLPTYMHRDFTIKALEAGVNVLCEKPMALEVGQCEDMIAAAQMCGKVLQIGHCVRFWPEYAKARQLVNSGEYGRVIAASFRRLSAMPRWSWNNWLFNKAKSGGALVDLHIHDSDFVQCLLGMPRAVYTQGLKGPSGDFDHVITQYIYEDDKPVAAEGGWMMMPGFGFEMSFNIVLEKATIIYDCTRKPAFKLCGLEGEPFTPQTEAGDGWLLEIAHFVKVVSGQKVPEIITPAQSLDSIRLILAERKSAESRKEVEIQ